MTLRIVHVASGREWRGGQRQVWLLARALAKHEGVSQVVVTGRGSELARRLANDRIPTRTPAWDGALDLRALAATLRAADRSSILHAHDSHALTLAGLASYVTGRFLVASRRVDVPVRRTGFWGRADRIIAVPGAEPSVMKLEAISRVTKMPLSRLQELAKTVSVFSPGCDSFFTMGGVYDIWNDDYSGRLQRFLKEDLSRDLRTGLGRERGGRACAQDVIDEVLRS